MVSKEKITQPMAILMYLQEKGSITHREADVELGVMRLAAKIKDLEKMGFNFIKTKEKVATRYDGYTYITRYALAAEED